MGNVFWKLMFYKFKLSHNAMEASKSICYAKGWSYYNNQMVHEVSLKLQKPRWSSKVGLKIWILKLSSKPLKQIVCFVYFHNLRDKSIWICQIVPHVTKILQNFSLTLLGFPWLWYKFFTFNAFRILTFFKWHFTLIDIFKDETQKNRSISKPFENPTGGIKPRSWSVPKLSSVSILFCGTSRAKQ